MRRKYTLRIIPENVRKMNKLKCYGTNSVKPGALHF